MWATGSGGGRLLNADRNGSVAATWFGEAMRRVIGVGGHLHGELSAGRQRRPPAGEHLGMIGHPLQAGVGDDQVVVTAARPLAEVAAGEAQSVVAAPDRLPRRVEHRIRRVDADHLLDAEAIGDLGGELAGSAAEVDAPPEPAGRLLDQGDQVPERLRPLFGEAPVLDGIPAVVHGVPLTRRAPLRHVRNLVPAHHLTPKTRCQAP